MGAVDWVLQHRLRLLDAHRRAYQQLERAAAGRLKISDQSATDHPLGIEFCVATRSRTSGDLSCIVSLNVVTSACMSTPSTKSLGV